MALTTLFAALPFVLGTVIVTALYIRERRAHHKTRRELTEQMADFREERDAAIRAVRWVPMKDPDLVKLAKTGCGTCHGAGHYQHVDKTNNRRSKAVCPCVFKRMANDPKYGALGDGTPVRLATKAELDAILPHERQSGEDGEADVIPLAPGNGEVH